MSNTELSQDIKRLENPLYSFAEKHERLGKIFAPVIRAFLPEVLSGKGGVNNKGSLVLTGVEAGAAVAAGALIGAPYMLPGYLLARLVSLSIDKLRKNREKNKTIEPEKDFYEWVQTIQGSGFWALRGAFPQGSELNIYDKHFHQETNGYEYFKLDPSNNNINWPGLDEFVLKILSSDVRNKQKGTKRFLTVRSLDGQLPGINRQLQQGKSAIVYETQQANEGLSALGFQLILPTDQAIKIIEASKNNPLLMDQLMDHLCQGFEKHAPRVEPPSELIINADLRLAWNRKIKISKTISMYPKERLLGLKKSITDLAVETVSDDKCPLAGLIARSGLDQIINLDIKFTDLGHGHSLVAAGGNTKGMIFEQFEDPTDENPFTTSRIKDLTILSLRTRCYDAFGRPVNLKVILRGIDNLAMADAWKLFTSLFPNLTFREETKVNTFEESREAAKKNIILVPKLPN